ncbi:MAG: exodeoxyribonuclease VII large subunit, partial [Oscillospiraceae bacterium]
MSILTVSEINRYISFGFKNDPNLRGKFIQGEISNFTHHLKTGHFYFTLKDSESSIKAIMFKSYAQSLHFIPENGMSVIAFASVQVFERDGVYQLYVTDMQPSGVGALYLAFEQLKEKLSKQGLFDEKHKLPIPKFPRKIGIITAKTGAALQDILNILKRRYPLTEVLVFSALVQGKDAPQSICNGILSAQTTDCDVLI